MDELIEFENEEFTSMGSINQSQSQSHYLIQQVNKMVGVEFYPPNACFKKRVNPARKWVSWFILF